MTFVDTSRAWPCTRLGMLALLLAACPSSTPGPDDGGAEAGLSVDEYCPRQAEVLCDGWGSCCGLEDRDRCIEMMLEECEAGEISSVRAGHSVLDGLVAERCLEAWAASFEDCLRNEDLGVACRYRWYGHAALGEDCRAVWHCQRGLGCALVGTAGTCVELPDAGESCEDGGVCQPGSYCSYTDWTCRPDPTLDEPCERDGICAAGRCVEGTCRAVPWC